MESKYLIQNILPDRIIHKLGMYSQTCAHIEHQLWLLYVDASDTPPDNQERQNELLRIRLNTKELKDALRKLAKNSDGLLAQEDSELLASILKEIDEGKNARDRAIHGAIQRSDEGSGFMVLGHWNEGTRKEPNFVKYDRPIDEAVLDGMLETVDRLLVQIWELQNRAKERSKEAEYRSC